MAENTYFEHHGAYPTTHSRSNPALRFLENYTKKIDSASYSGSYLPYYHPTPYSTTQRESTTSTWKWITGLFAPFDRIHMDSKHFLVISKPDGTHVIYAEWLAHFWLKGKKGEVTIPRSMVFMLGKAEGEGEVVGFEGLQILDARLYYDRSMLVPFLRKSEQEVEKFGSAA